MKVCIVGSQGIGKTSFVSKFTRNSISDSVVITETSDYEVSITVKGRIVDLDIHDMQMCESPIERKRVFNQTDCFLLCFAMNDRKSFEDIKTKWFNEVTEVSDGRCVLVGLKADLKDVKQSVVTDTEICNLAQQLKTCGWATLSIYRHKGIKDLFDFIAYGVSIPCFSPTRKESERKKIAKNRIAL
ncbi:hypothetical protein EIN_096340 [Entamoeba invadens IP1]|uniref:small monomeric GTPase n=1 Tax=Entamoeba invadens IP1 TaxID=370355 RepID=A0A0A1U0I3_ENTIV|nr:hypothetical protein EIN_096340 [Entamoeba invadens IP1]ELP87377.1 hypothetical protein EIN_096340 [Entamoeba invadens IP1]|eukprot:XP_004254148.1 hypothetical protein EIN_096340 [Entamoeba invadens IP1]